MKHPYNKKTRNDCRRKKNAQYKFIWQHDSGYDPYIPRPEYVDREMEKKVRATLSDKSARRELYFCSGRFEGEPYFIHHRSRANWKKECKRVANKRARQVRKSCEDCANYSGYRKTYPLWWEMY